MKEILFRGKITETCKYKGQWLEGFYGEQDGLPFIAIKKSNGLFGFFCNPLTVTQFTGLFDKNGKRVFEGDIIQVKRCGAPSMRFLPIYFGMYIDVDSDFDYPATGFYINSSDCCANIGCLLQDDIEWEVIGNIFDNHELLD